VGRPFPLRPFALLLWLAGCDPGPKILDCQVRCGPSRECPASTTCDAIENFCRPQGAAGACGCFPGDTRSCGSAVGECRAGTSTCQADRSWAACEGEVRPAPEVCDGKDNDCDGFVDQHKPTFLTAGADTWDGAATTTGSLLFWQGTTLQAQRYDQTLSPVGAPLQLGAAGQVDRVISAAQGDRVWLLWEAASATAAQGALLDPAANDVPVPVQGLPRAEATGRLTAVATASGLVAAWPIGPNTVRVGRWSSAAAAPATTDLNLPVASIAVTELFLSSQATSLGFAATVGNLTVRGVIELNGPRTSQAPAQWTLLDTPGGVGSFWCRVNAGRIEVVGYLEVFGGTEAVLDSADGNGISSCWAHPTATHPVVTWVRGGEITFGVPQAGGGVLRRRTIDLEQVLPASYVAANGGGPFTTLFYSALSGSAIYGVQACEP
jgi:Putative metal-binding motif